MHLAVSEPLLPGPGWALPARATSLQSRERGWLRLVELRREPWDKPKSMRKRWSTESITCRKRSSAFWKRSLRRERRPRGRTKRRLTRSQICRSASILNRRIRRSSSKRSLRVVNKRSKVNPRDSRMPMTAWCILKKNASKKSKIARKDRNKTHSKIAKGWRRNTKRQRT